MRYRLHLLGLPHTSTSRLHACCAYSQKVYKFADLMGARGHTIFHYGNEGSDPPNVVEHIQLLTEAERSSFFGPHDPQRLYDLKWSGSEPYWRLFNERAIPELQKRVKKGDFILSPTGGDCLQPIGDAFPGSYRGDPQTAMMVEPFIGYYGPLSRYRVYESNTHREWCLGSQGIKMEDNDSAVIPNFYPLADFKVGEVSDKIKRIQEKPYYLLIGRMIESKGISIACDATEEIGARLVLAGQGNLKIDDDDVIFFGHATIEERAALMTEAIAVFAPTRYREPFGGVAAEAQLCGTPAITTDHGAFCETVDPEWRCRSHLEFAEAAIRAAELTASQRTAIKQKAESRFSYEAVAPQFERYFSMLYSRWGAGWYEVDSLEDIAL